MQEGKQETLQLLLRAERAVAVLRGSDPDIVYERARAVLEGGIRAIEITLTVPGAIDVILRLAGDADAIVGAGSVRTASDVDRCLDAGALFVVSPVCQPEVIRRAKERQALVIPGAMTPTEVSTAWDLGGDLIKIFPAARLGPKFLSDLHGPLPEIPLVPTGGITDINAIEYLKAGAALIGIGSWLTVGGLDETRRRSSLIRAIINKYQESHNVHSN